MFRIIYGLGSNGADIELISVIWCQFSANFVYGDNSKASARVSRAVHGSVAGAAFSDHTSFLRVEFRHRFVLVNFDSHLTVRAYLMRFSECC